MDEVYLYIIFMYLVAVLSLGGIAYSEHLKTKRYEACIARFEPDACKGKAG